MRLRRLALEGFASWRERAEVRFPSRGLLALTGPTGAGKSSLIDAVVFALYGMVPRFDDARAVAAVITKGESQARVDLEIEVGTQIYRAVRVVRQTGGTVEARLERDGVALASGADAVSRAVRELVGLDARQFTSCVLLPQGETATLLHQRPAERKELLVRLLGLEVYDRIRELARVRASVLDERRTALESRLAGELGAVSESSLEAARDRCRELARLAAEAAERAPLAREMARAAAMATAEAANVQAVLARLAAVATPPAVASLAGALAAARARRDQAATLAVQAASATASARERLAALPDAGSLEALARDHRAVAERSTELSVRGVELARADQAMAALAARRSEQEGFHHAAQAHYAELARAQQVAALTSGLAPGDPCPVCARPLEPGDWAACGDLDGAEAERSRTAAALAAIDRELAAATARHAAEAARHQLARKELDHLGERLATAPSAEEVARLLAARETAAEALAVAIGEERRLSEVLAAAERELASREVAASAARRELAARRDELADLGAPSLAELDVEPGWQRLKQWAVAEHTRRLEVAAWVEQEASRLAADLRAAREALLGRLAEAGLSCPPGAEPEAVTAAELGRAEAGLEALLARVDEAARARVELAASERERDLARTLARELEVRRFPTWLLGEAVRRLAGAASARLRQLSQGAYSLAVADAGTGFEVIDHGNADLRRPARTLSGGETFLAALALAVALAEHVADLAAGRAPRIETLLLDEGFGSLDAETLEVVAGGLEALADGERLVCIVTHVPELAARIPQRIEIRRDARSSRLERIGT